MSEIFCFFHITKPPPSNWLLPHSPFIDSHFIISDPIQPRRLSIDSSMGVLKLLRTNRSKVIASKVSTSQLISLLKSYTSVPDGLLLDNLGRIPSSGDTQPLVAGANNKITANCFVHGYQASFVAGTMQTTTYTPEFFSNIVKVDEDVTPVQHACQIALSRADAVFRHPVKTKNVYVFHVSFAHEEQQEKNENGYKFCIVVQRCRHKTCVLSVSDVSPSVLLNKFPNINMLKERLCTILAKKLVPDSVLRAEILKAYGKSVNNAGPVQRVKKNRLFRTK